MTTDANTSDDSTPTPGDVAALLERADAILHAEDDKIAAAKAAAVFGDFVTAKNDMIRALARGADNIHVHGRRLTPHARQQHQLLAEEIRHLVDLLQGRADAS
jgi:hypothetical protein